MLGEDLDSARWGVGVVRGEDDGPSVGVGGACLLGGRTAGDLLEVADSCRVAVDGGAFGLAVPVLARAGRGCRADGDAGGVGVAVGLLVLVADLAGQLKCGCVVG